MRKNEPLQLKQEALIIDCIDALAAISPSDLCLREAMDALLEASQIIETYPNLDKLKRAVLKQGTADYYAVHSAKLLRNCVLGEAPPQAFSQINHALNEALECLQASITHL